jgi:hypothetical protein
LTWFGPSILGFPNHLQYVDTRDLVSNYLLICWSNDLARLIKVVVHDGLSKLRFWPKVQFGPEVAQTGVPPSLLCCTPRARRFACVSPMHQQDPHLICHDLLLMGRAATELLSTPIHSPSLSGAHPCHCHSGAQVWPRPPWTSDEAPCRRRSCLLEPHPSQPASPSTSEHHASSPALPPESCRRLQT